MEDQAVEPAKLHDFATRYARGWCTQDPERVAAFYAEQGSLSVNNGEPDAGRAASAEVARGFMDAFPDMRVTSDELVREPEGIRFRWTLTGTNTGPGGTGKAVRISGHELWKFDDRGLISESKGHFDSAEYERQLQYGASG